ncbi:MAG: FoF1 ATP synthase subunit gamma [Synechococcaceae cyanobacterium]|nr:FoF1 ATP synthase subunit gamma [Synechococcaceae cyanobacterium]
MPQLEEIRDRIRLTEDLQAVVRSLKAMARVGVHRFASVGTALDAYAATVELALQAYLLDRRHRDAPPLAPFPLPPSGDGGSLGLILFGTDHGLCGAFNERILAAAAELRGGGDPAATELAVVGGRLAALLQAREGGDHPVFPLPHAVEGVTRLVQDLLLLLEGWLGRRQGIGRVVLVHHRARGTTSSEPVHRQLLPLERQWLAALERRRWESSGLPLVAGKESELFPALLREQFRISLHRATVESLTSEHGARLAAMHAAERNIEERLEELNQQYRRQRQNAITDELLDIVAGFEALNRES